MMETPWLAYASIVVWLGIGGYLFWLGRKAARLETRLARMEYMAEKTVSKNTRGGE